MGRLVGLWPGPLTLAEGSPPLPVDLLTNTAEIGSSGRSALAQAVADPGACGAMAPRGEESLRGDVSFEAMLGAPCRLTRLPRPRYDGRIVTARPAGLPHLGGYRGHTDAATLKPDSVARALLVDRVIPMCPPTIDLSAGITHDAARGRLAL